jgi:hypothetical protein
MAIRWVSWQRMIAAGRSMASQATYQAFLDRETLCAQTPELAAQRVVGAPWNMMECDVVYPHRDSARFTLTRGWSLPSNVGVKAWIPGL